LILQQHPHHLRAEFVGNFRIRQQTGGEFGFFLLHFVDAFLDGVLAEQLVNEDWLFLADAVGAVGGLGLGGGVLLLPPRLQRQHKWRLSPKIAGD
jgi:hypothetical protein